MWERIKGLWQQQDHPELARSEQEQQTDLDFLSQELQAQRLDGLEQQLRPLTTSKFRPVAQRAERMLGLVWFHQRKYTKALPIFEDLARQTNSLNDWFNVVTSATLGGEIARGAGAFERALERQRSQADEASADAAAQPSIAMLHLLNVSLKSLFSPFKCRTALRRLTTTARAQHYHTGKQQHTTQYTKQHSLSFCFHNTMF